MGPGLPAHGVMRMRARLVKGVRCGRVRASRWQQQTQTFGGVPHARRSVQDSNAHRRAGLPQILRQSSRSERSGRGEALPLLRPHPDARDDIPSQTKDNHQEWKCPGFTL